MQAPPVQAGINAVVPTYQPRGLGFGGQGLGVGVAGQGPSWAPGAGRGLGGQQPGGGVQWGLAGLGGAQGGLGRGESLGQQVPTMEMMMEWGLTMVKRMHDMEGKPGKKKRRLDGVDDNDEEEDLIPVTFAHIEGEDDGQVKICWALRDGKLASFNGNQEEFWRRQPKVLHPIRESYPESHLRLDPVNPRVTLRDHDRGAKRTIKQYAKVNFRVVKSRATITPVGLDSHDVGLAREYEECTGAYQLVSALWQYAINLFLIRREDYSGLLLLKVLHDVKFFQPVLLSKVVGKKQRDAKQVEVMQHFIDEAMERNSMLGKQAKPPLSYEELLRIARASANLIYAGTGVGLDWGVDTGTCGIDPYSLAEGVTNDSNNNSGKGGKGRGGGSGQGGGQGGGQGNGKSGVASGGSGSSGGSGFSGGSGSSGAAKNVRSITHAQWCKDWNRGECR